jgi:hypothetical protein
MLLIGLGKEDGEEERPIAVAAQETTKLRINCQSAFGWWCVLYHKLKGRGGRQLKTTGRHADIGENLWLILVYGEFTDIKYCKATVCRNNPPHSDFDQQVCGCLTIVLICLSKEKVAH